MKTLSLTAMICTLAGPIFADITADDVADFLKYSTEFDGGTLTFASQDRDGDTLTLRGYHMEFASPEGSLIVDADWVSLRERDDGTVELTSARETNFVFTTVEDGFEFSNTRGVIIYDGTATIASGVPNVINMEMPSTNATIELSTTNNIWPDDIFEMSIDITGLTANVTQTIKGDTQFGISGWVAVERVDVDISEKNTLFDTQSTSAITSTGLRADIDMFSSRFDAFNPYRVTSDDTGGVTLFVSETDFNVNITSLTGNVAVTGHQGPLRMLVSMIENAILVNMSSHDADTHIVADNMPAPSFDIAYDNFEIEYIIPLNTTDVPVDFRVYLGLHGLTLNEDTWAIFDLEMTIPRDPANFVFDLTGQSLTLLNIFDPARTENQETSVFEPTVVTLSEFLIEAAGVVISGSGSVDIIYEEGFRQLHFPTPVGSAEFSASGLHALMGKLGALGIIKPQMIFAARALLGLYSTQESVPDTLTTGITFSEDGTIAVNGAPVR